MKILVYFLLIFSLVACKSEPKEEKIEETTSGFLRFEDALQNDVAHLLQFSNNILYKKWENQVLVDSSFIDTTQFINIIDQFWMEEMELENFNELYQEVPIVDPNTNQIQFQYFAKNSNAILSEVKVITNAHQAGHHEISTVLFEISDDEKRQKIMWKLKERIQIVTIPKNNDGKVIVEELIWEPSQFFE